MINNVYLINTNYIKSVSAVGNNVDDKYLQTAILKAQIMGVMPLLGEKLYDKLCSLVSAQSDPNADPKTTIDDPINKPYKTLLEVYVASYLVEKSQAELQMILYAKQRNEGVVAYSDANTNNIGVADIKYIINCFNQDAEYMGKRMTNFIIANMKDYPEYRSCKIGEVKANKNKSEFCKITL